jgi:hypothetical protein
VIEAVRIPITEAQRTEARSWQESIYATGLRDRPAPDRDVNSTDSFVIGYVGEYAVAEWLEAIGARYRWTVDLRGSSAAAEFRVWGRKGVGYLEVKTSRRRYHDRMMIPPRQKLDADVFVAVDIPDDGWTEARLMGWLTHAEVEKLPILTFAKPTRTARYVDMRPMSQLAAFLPRRDADEPIQMRRRILRRKVAA